MSEPHGGPTAILTAADTDGKPSPSRMADWMEWHRDEVRTQARGGTGATSLGAATLMPGDEDSLADHLGILYRRAGTVTPDDFTGTDQEKWDACIAAAIAGGKKIYVDRAYSLTAATNITTLAHMQRLEIVGGPLGALDYSGMTTWARSSTSGLLRVAGSKGTPVALTKRTARAGFTLRLDTGSRSGTTATFTTSEAHGLSVGDRIWIEGGTPSAAAGQRVFFSYAIGTSSATKGTPFTVASAADSTTFTVTVADTGDTTLSTTAYVSLASDWLTVADTTGFARGDILLLTSDAVRTNDGAESIQIGEFVEVAEVVSGTELWLMAGVVDTYPMSDNPTVAKCTMPIFKVRDLKLIGNGPNFDGIGGLYGDRGIVQEYCYKPEVVNCVFREVDQMAIQQRSCISPLAEKNDIVFNPLDEAGRQEGVLHIQYGIAVGMASQGANTIRNRIVGGRHAIVQDGTGIAGYGGVVRDWTIEANECRGQWLDAISTHQSAGRTIYRGNKIFDGRGGINVRYSEETILDNNIIDASIRGIYLYRVIREVQLGNNRVFAGRNAVQITSFTDDSLTGAKIRMTGGVYESGDVVCNVIHGVENGTVDFRAVGVEFAGGAAGGSLVRLNVGTDDGGGVTGRIADCLIRRGANAGAGAAAIFATNGRWLAVENNDFDHGGGAFTRLVFVDGAQSTTCTVRGNRSIGGLSASIEDVTLSTGTGHVTAY